MPKSALNLNWFFLTLVFNIETAKSLHFSIKKKKRKIYLKGELENKRDKLQNKFKKNLNIKKKKNSRGWKDGSAGKVLIADMIPVQVPAHGHLYPLQL